MATAKEDIPVDETLIAEEGVEREGDLVDRLGRPSSSCCLASAVVYAIGSELMQSEIAEPREIERIVARTKFAGSSERLQRPATLRQRVLRGAQRYSVGDRSQCAGRRA
jgi:hypothetical protein